MIATDVSDRVGLNQCRSKQLLTAANIITFYINVINFSVNTTLFILLQLQQVAELYYKHFSLRYGA
jgi:hypothetical protein